MTFNILFNLIILLNKVLFSQLINLKKNTMSLITDLIIVLIAYLYILLIIFIPMTLKKRDVISKFTARKLVHLFSGLIVLIVPFLSWSYFAIIIAGSITIITYFCSSDSKIKPLKELYDTIGEKAEENVGMLRRRSYLQGPFHYSLSITLLITFFVIFAPNQFYFPIAGILIMIISDTLASMVGKKIGRIKIKLSWTKSERTLEGSLTFFITAFILCLVILSLFGLIITTTQIPLTIEQVIIYSLIISALGTLIELISPSTWDDLTVPIGTTLIFFILTLYN